MFGSMGTWPAVTSLRVAGFPFPRALRRPLARSNTRSADRRQWARVLDGHAAALLALANLLVLDEATAEAMTGLVLTDHTRSNVAVATEDTRRLLAVALIAACQRAEDSLALPPGTLLDRQARAAVGLAIFARLSYREVATEMNMPERQALVLLRCGLLSRDDTPTHNRADHQHGQIR